jgi:ligand-binding sensor domain-containing protein
MVSMLTRWFPWLFKMNIKREPTKLPPVLEEDWGEARTRQQLGLCCLAVLILFGSLAQAVCQAPSPQYQLSPGLIQQMHGGSALSQTRVERIVQDSRGFLWMGTQYGLNRYDGAATKQFTHDPQQSNSIGGSYIHELYRDHLDNLWISCDQAFDRYDPKNETFRHYDLGLPAPVIRSIYEGKDGMMWLGTATGLIRLDPASGGKTYYRPGTGDLGSLQDPDVMSVGEDRRGNVWVATRTSLEMLNVQTGRVLKHISKVTSYSGASFHEDKFGTFWLVAHGGIFTLDPQRERLTQLTHLGGVDLSTLGPVRVLLEDRAGDMWFGTERSGVIHLAHTGQVTEIFAHHAGQLNTLTSNRVISLFEDSCGDIWVGLNDAVPDIILRNGARFKAFPYLPSAQEGLQSPLVTVLFEEAPGQLLIGSTGALQRLDEKTGQYSTPLTFVPHTDVLDVFRESDRSMWFATTDGLIRYNAKTGVVKGYGKLDSSQPKLSSPHVQRILKDQHGRMWAATWGGLDLYLPESDSFRSYLKVNPSENYSSIAEAPDGTIWLGGIHGLEHFLPDTGNVVEYRYSGGAPGTLSDPRVNSLHFDKTGQLWVGTQNGLDWFDPASGKFVTFSEKSGLSGNVVSCILEDNKNHLWLSTNRGISRFDPGTKGFVTYSVVDGLPGLDFTGWGACAKGKDGQLFFGGFNGATAFWPDNVSDQIYDPPIALSGFQIQNRQVPVGPGQPLSKAVSYADDAWLASSQNTFEIDFAVMNFRNPDSVRTRYMLKGLNENWIEASSNQRSATYISLPPGTYTLRIQKMTNQGSWSEPGLSFSVHIRRPWWDAPLMRLAYFSALALIAWLSYTFRVEQLKTIFRTRLEARLAERTRMAREVHDTILQGLQGLVLYFSSATLLISDDDPQKALFTSAIERAESSLADGRDAVHEMRISPIGLAELPKAIEKFGSGLSPIRGEEYIVISRSIIGDLGFDVDEVFQILKEAVRNAFRHANGTRIVVTFNPEATGLEITVADNGIGFPLHVLSGNYIPRHWGIRGIQERAAAIGASVVFSNPPAGGALMTVRLLRCKENVRQRFLRIFGLRRGQ